MRNKIFSFVCLLGLFSLLNSCANDEVTIIFLQHDQFYDEIDSVYYFSNNIVSITKIKKPKGYTFSEDDFAKLYNQGQSSEIKYVIFGTGYGYYSFSPFFKSYDTSTGKVSDEFKEGKVSNDMTLHFIVKE